MKRLPLITLLATLAIIIGGAFLLSKKEAPDSTNLPLPSSYEYFWGDGCPHCAEVQEFFDSWEGKDKIDIQKYEVWSSRENAQRLRKRAVSCGFQSNKIGVPLLFTPEGKCISGDKPIIDFFKQIEIDEKES